MTLSPSLHFKYDPRAYLTQKILLDYKPFGPELIFRFNFKVSPFYISVFITTIVGML